MPNNDQPFADVLLVTVTSAETRAVFDALRVQTGQAHAAHHLDDKTYYDLGQVSGARVWLVRSEQGAAVPGGALLTVNNAIRTLHPAAVILVGVGFGTRPQRQRVGDVLVATQLQLYEPQRIDGSTGEPQVVPSGDRASVSPRLLDRFRHGELAWPEERAQVEFGLLLTGEKLVEHPAVLAELLAREPLALGGELEGAGLYVAALHCRVDWIVVRGIAGWPGSASADPRADHALAARNAAAFTAHTLAEGGFASTPTRTALKSILSPADPTPAPLVFPEEALPSEVRLALAQIRDPGQPLAVRLEAGMTLGRLGDPRLLDPRTGDAPIGGYWCPIEPGPFWFGDDMEQSTLPYPYKIARFPVTNAEYQHFIDAGGYAEQHWWSAEGWRWRLPGGHNSSWEKNELPITRPWYWDNATYNQLSQPVVGISWYEAVAYCAWLTAQGYLHSWLPNNRVLRLPTWLEWQRAARHTDRRRYPWGDTAPGSARANYDATGIMKPVPVGCFPAGQATCGALDMAGNVWEWTIPTAGSPEQSILVADVVNTEKIILAGGSSCSVKDHLSWDDRNWGCPGDFNDFRGLRVIWSPILLF